MRRPEAWHQGTMPIIEMPSGIKAMTANGHPQSRFFLHFLEPHWHAISRPSDTYPAAYARSSQVTCVGDGSLCKVS